MDNKSFFENTVSADNQLHGDGRISYEIENGAKKKVLFIGNSITRHGVCEEIGWMNDWGMAASSKDKDYVHVTISKLKQKFGLVSACILQVADWERKYYLDEAFDDHFVAAKKFDADIVIIRLGENVAQDKLSEYSYEEYFEKFVKYFDNGHCQTIITSLFWENHAIDNPTKSVADKNGYDYADIRKYGYMDDCKALGEYAHQGVAMHPSDKGMRMIAEEIIKCVK